MSNAHDAIIIGAGIIGSVMATRMSPLGQKRKSVTATGMSAVGGRADEIAA